MTNQGRLLINIEICALLLTLTTAARGQDAHEAWFGKGVDSQAVWATPGPSNFVTVESSDIINHTGVAFTAKFDYYINAVRTVVDDRLYFAVGNALVGDFLWGFGLLNWFQLGVSLPVVLRQGGHGASDLVDVDTTGTYGLSSSALKDLRLNVKTRLLGGKAPMPDRRDFGLALDLGVTLPTGDETDFAGDNSVVFFPTAIVDFHRCKFSAALNFGARLRLEKGQWIKERPVKADPTQDKLLTVGHQGAFGLGITGHLADRRFLLSAEGTGLIELAATERFGLEYRGALGYVADKDRAITIWLSAGSSVGNRDLPAIPEFRGIVTISYAPGAKESPAPQQ